MSALKHLLDYNRSWVKELNSKNSQHLSSRSVGSLTKYLWIDCLDNCRLPDTLLGISIDEILVYRNLAHQINHSDLNCLSVLQYAFQILGIKHVIVCGHYDCRLLYPATQAIPLQLIENWLYPVQEVSEKYKDWLQLYQPESLRVKKLCELNVIEQVIQLCNTTVVQSTWKRQQELTIHGWVYSPDDGLLHDLAIDIGGEAEIVSSYRAAILKCIGKS